MGKHRKPQRSQETSSQKKPRPDAKPVEKNGPDARPDWHGVELPAINVPAKLHAPSPRLVETLQQHADALLDVEASEYAKKTAVSSTHAFQNKMMSDGTWEDRVSVLTLMVQESPIHTCKHFESLLNMAKKKSRDQALLALEALKDMLGQGTVLPSDRRLRAFGKQPGLIAALQGVSPQWTPDKPLPKGLSNTHLIYWAYEDRLKRGYFELLRIIESWCGDEVEFARIRATTFVWELLKDKPEQEENLLRLVVNKLGDRSKKVASKASFLLLELQRFHPAMKPEIIKSIQEDILLRSGQSLGAKYYAIITLNQTILNAGAPEVANALLDVYFNLFTTILNQMNQTKKKEEEETKLAQNSKKRKRQHGKVPVASEKPEQELTDKINAQILTGINRAFPYSNKDGEKFEQHVDTMFRIAHSSNFNTSVQSLLLIQQISSVHQISSDRFMRTLYESLLDPRLLSSSKQTVYLNLLYRSLKSDASIRRVKAFVKRLLQVLTIHEPPFICAALFLIAELGTLYPSLRALVEQPELLDYDEDEYFRDADVVAEEGTEDTVNAPTQTNKTNLYDPRKRDPLHANADLAPLWELPALALHYHPSIPLFASYLLHPTTTKRPAKPDPTSHSLSHFLDRFVYRNPKTRADAQTRGTSLMQPALASNNATDVLITKAGGARGFDGASLNTEAFWTRKAAEVKPEEVFFHRYFEDLHAQRNKKTKPKPAKPADDDSEGDEYDELGENEDEIWKALTSSRPELEGGSDVDGFESDDDEDDVDLEAAMQSDSDVEINLEDDDEDEVMADADADAGSDLDSNAAEVDPISKHGTGLSLDDLMAADTKNPSKAQTSSKDQKPSKAEKSDKSDKSGKKSSAKPSAKEDEQDIQEDIPDDDDSLQLSDSDAVWSSDDSDAPMPTLINFPTGADADTSAGADDKEDGKDKSGRAKKRRRLKDLPTFASVEDYAALLGDSE